MLKEENNQLKNIKFDLEAPTISSEEKQVHINEVINTCYSWFKEIQNDLEILQFVEAILDATDSDIPDTNKMISRSSTDIWRELQKIFLFNTTKYVKKSLKSDDFVDLHKELIKDIKDEDVTQRSVRISLCVRVEPYYILSDGRKDNKQ
jgi:hypothetical protein